MNYKFDGSNVFFTSDTHFYHGEIDTVWNFV